MHIFYTPGPVNWVKLDTNYPPSFAEWGMGYDHHGQGHYGSGWHHGSQGGSGHGYMMGDLNEDEIEKLEKEKSIRFKQIQDRLVAKLLRRFPTLFKKWVQSTRFIEFSDSPWIQLDRDISRCRLALITTGGVHLRSQTPFNMADPAGDPTFREIPASTSPNDLSITHNYYDHADADKDINITPA